nr:MAG TPA: minor tail protein [Caudoviricetes sp.]
MSNRIKGITVEIGGDTTKLDKALAGTNKQLSTTQKSLKDVERLLKLDPGNADLLEQKQRLLAQAVEGTSQKLDTLRQAALNADQALQRGKDYQAKYEPLKAELDSVAASMRGMEANQESMQAKLESGQISTEQYDAFQKKLEETRKKYKELQQAVKDLDKEFAGAKMSTEQYDALQRELAATEKSLEDLKRTAKDSSSALKKFGDTAGKVSSTAGKVKNAFAPVTAAIGGVAAAAIATVPATEEFRADLSLLDNNARQAGVGIDAARQAFMDFNTVSGETDSSIEAVSNLLQAGFTESNLQIAVEGLANAAATFPDTLKIESLADSLQETLATGTATGQFGELLDRLGVGAENFSANLAQCTTEVEKQNYALSVLVGGPLQGVYEGWRQNNQGLVESREASLELQTAISELAESLQPFVTELTELATKFLDWFNSLDEGTQKAIVGIGGLVAAISPMAGVIEKVSGVLPKLVDLFDKLGVKGTLVMIAIGAIVYVIAQLVDAWDDMSSMEKVIAVLGLVAAAALTAAIALGAFQSAATMGLAAAGIVAGIIAITAAINSANSRAERAAAYNSTMGLRSSSSGVPGLAEGGVIPPNQPFLAMLGDNKQEPEIVAPYSTIKQAASEAMAERPAGGTGVAEIYLDGVRLGRAVYPYVQGESVRQGAKLITR